MNYKLGSLFDGSGGFPLAGSLCGIEPVWASEVEPYPIAVTRSRFPNMKHLGDISKVRGGEIEPVDIITFGSPCQDLSVAGKRAGLKHTDNGDEETTRSGLFMEAVRIIKEMREATNGEYPTFAVWENVPGAFSSNKGDDFRVVLEELIKIVEPTAVMPAVPKNGWAYSDSYVGDGWSLAYRVFDAQYWGVPQRRRRIYLVADFRGECAEKVLFERDGLRGYFTQGRTPWQSLTSNAEDRSGANDRAGEGINGDVAGTLDDSYYKGCGMRQGVEREVVFQPVAVLASSAMNAEVTDGKIVPCLMARAGTGGNQLPLIAAHEIHDDQGGQQITVRTDGKAPTLRAETHGNLPAVMEPVTIEPGIAAREGGHIYEGVCGTLRANAGDNQMAVAYAAGFKAGQGAQARSIGREDEKCPTLAAEAGGNSVPSVCVKCYDARRNGDGQTVSTLTGNHENRITDYTSVVCMATQQGVAEIMENLCPTITASAGMSGNNQPVVYMAHGQANAEILEDKSPCLNCNHEQPIVCGVDCRNMNESPELYPTLQAKPNGGQSLNFMHAVRIRYIVRRLTPTECARLQGFADRHGDIDQKEDFTDEEYRFWLNVRNTHAAVNGKPQKDYTKAQMLTWYNGLHTDSSEYKMWGNGIALPCALYVMQGIQDTFGSCCTVQDGSEKKTVSDHEKEIMRGLLLYIGRKLEELEERIREVLA